jgi:hypothetical protein
MSGSVNVYFTQEGVQSGCLILINRIMANSSETDLCQSLALMPSHSYQSWLMY